MDFGEIITKYSRPEINNMLVHADDIKKKKLAYAEKLIENLKKNNPQLIIINILNYK